MRATELNPRILRAMKFVNILYARIIIRRYQQIFPGECGPLLSPIVYSVAHAFVVVALIDCWLLIDESSN